jgi:mRNA interferase MazF
MATVPTPRRGEIWLIDFDPAVGAEIRKTRPAVVISIDSIGRLPLRLVVPVTDWKAQYTHYPWFVELPASSSSTVPVIPVG